MSDINEPIGTRARSKTVQNMSNKPPARNVTRRLETSDGDEPISKRLRSRAFKKTAKNSNVQPISRDSLLIINDDCLYTILEYLTVDDLCRVVEVCTRLEGLATETFARRFSTISLTLSDPVMFDRVLSKFGPAIKSLNVSGHSLDKPEDVKIVPKYCKKLEKLTMHDVKIDCRSFRPLFARLKFVDLRDCVLFSGKYLTFNANADEMEELVVSWPTSADIPKRIFPKLKTVQWHHRDTHATHYFFRLLQLNSHIKTLHIHADVYTRLSREDFKKIAHLAKGIEELFVIVPTYGLDETIALGNFQCLKRLEIRNQYNTHGLVGRIAEVLFQHNIQIEHFAMIATLIKRKDFKSVLKLKTLRHVHLNILEEFNDEDLVLLAKHLPLIQNITLDLKYLETFNISFDGLIEMVRFAGNLSVFKLYYYHHSFDRQSYELLADVIRKRNNGPLKLVFGWENRSYPDLTNEIVENNKTVGRDIHSGFCLTIR